MPEASRLQAMRLSTRLWPSTISITMMKDVMGACVTAERKAAIPNAMSVGVSTWPVSRAMSCPSAPPIDSAGAKYRLALQTRP